MDQKLGLLQYEDLRRSESESKIFEAIEELGGSVNAGQIADHIDTSRSNVQYIVKRLRNENRLEGTLSQKRILYTIPSFTTLTHSQDQQHSHHSQMPTVKDVKDGSQEVTPEYPDKPCVQCGSVDVVMNEEMTAYKCKDCGRFYTKKA